MEEKPKDESLNDFSPEESKPLGDAPSVIVTEPSKPEIQRKHSLHLKKLPKWLIVGLLFVVFIGLITSSYLLYKKSNDLSQRNKNLNSTLDGYKKANAKPKKLTDAVLQPLTSDTKAQPAPADDGSYGGTAVQVNADDPTSATPKFVGGEYAPYWLLSKFVVTIPDGTKMVRTTEVSTDGQLLTANKEGWAACGGEGIYMAVSSTISVPGSKFTAEGSSASYDRAGGCSGVEPLVVTYVRYYPMAKASQYKYMELVTADCTTPDKNLNCTSGNADKTKWRLHSGIVPINAPEYKIGESVQRKSIMEQLYNRDKNGADFSIDCPNDAYSSYECTAGKYKNRDYNTALKDPAYIYLKNIILNMHE